MRCSTIGKLTKKKIAVFSSIGLGIASISYVVFTITNNPAITATVPAIVSLAICPTMCIAIGGAMVFMNRFSRNKNNTNNQKQDLEEEMSSYSCGSNHHDSLISGDKKKHLKN
jgi:hypothetical protein